LSTLGRPRVHNLPAHIRKVEYMCEVNKEF
jgi:hypothetical protein